MFYQAIGLYNLGLLDVLFGEFLLFNCLILIDGSFVIQSNAVLFDSLRRLELMALSVETLKV